ncbi:MAG: hypothetical protein V1759_01060, partial [bacterium]
MENKLGLVSESIFLEQPFDETSGKKKSFIARGILLSTDKPTLNNRLYPKNIVTRAIEDFKESHVKKGSAYVLDGHPTMHEHPKPSEVVGRVKEIWMEDDNVMGDIIVFDNTTGKDVQAIIRGESSLGISLRGFSKQAKIGRDGIQIMGEDFKFLGFDTVINPASQGAGVQNYHLEQDQGGNKNVVKTIEELRAEFPELVKQIEEAKEVKVKEALMAEFETMKGGIAEAAITKIAESMKAGEITENDEVKCPHCSKVITVTGIESNTTEEVEEKIESLSEQVNTVTAENVILKTENAKLVKESTDAKVSNYITETLTANKILPIKIKEALKGKLGSPVSLEDAKAKLEGEITFAESLVKETGYRNLTGYQ